MPSLPRQLELSSGKGDWRAFYKLLLRPRAADERTQNRLMLPMVPTALLDGGRLSLFVFTNRDGFVSPEELHAGVMKIGGRMSSPKLFSLRNHFLPKLFLSETIFPPNRYLLH